MNLLLAIGAKYSHLTEAEWRGDDRDHLIYMLRATHLLGMKDTVMIIAGPDLRLVQAVSLCKSCCVQVVANHSFLRQARCRSISLSRDMSAEHG
jgi:hypothetical protein